MASASRGSTGSVTHWVSSPPRALTAYMARSAACTSDAAVVDAVGTTVMPPTLTLTCTGSLGQAQVEHPHGLPEPLGVAHRGGEVDARPQDEELVAAEATDQLALAGRSPLQRPRHGDQALVAGEVAVGVVVVLEAVEVDERHRQRQALAPAALELAVEGVVEGAAARGAGEVVEGDELVELGRVGLDARRGRGSASASMPRM